MDKEKLRKEIEGIIGKNKDSVGKILDVIERECRTANYEGYRTAVIESSGTMGCSFD